MEFEKLKQVIAEVLNVDPEEITPQTTFWMTLEQTLWMYFRSLWESRRNLILRSPRRKQRRLPQLRKQLN